MKNGDILWYVARVTYSRETILKEFLDSRNIENFLPMRYVYTLKGRKKVRKLVPAIHNFVFIHSSKETIDRIKRETEYKCPIRYMVNSQREIITVPNEQMKSFIAVSGTYNEQIQFLSGTEKNYKVGDLVRVIDGEFAGVEGRLIKVQGSKYRQLIVEIHGVMAVITAKIHPSLIEAIVK